MANQPQRENKVPVSKTGNPTPWQPHDDPAEGRRDIEESNRQASQSQPTRLRNSNKIEDDFEPSDSGPEYFGVARKPLS
jgi:hypothetical protein